MDCSPPGSSVHGILQARILDWVAIPFSRGSSQPGIEPRSPALQADFYQLSYKGRLKVKVAQSCLTLLDPTDCLWNSPSQNTGVGSLSLLQGIFPIQGSNPGLLHCKWILYQLSHKGSPRILEWVVYTFSSGSSRPRNQTGVSCIAGRFFTN